MYTQKIANIFDHIQDHSRLGLENKSGRIFCPRQVYFTNSCRQIWGCLNQPFIIFTAALKHGIRNPETETETEYGIKYQWWKIKEFVSHCII